MQYLIKRSNEKYVGLNKRKTNNDYIAIRILINI